MSHFTSTSTRILRVGALIVATLLLTAASCDVDGGGGSFDLSLDPTSLTVAAGATGDVGVTVDRIEGFTGQVDLRADDVPAGAAVTFSPSSASTASTATVTAGATSAPGTYAVTVVGESGSLTRSAQFSLVVTEANDTETPGFGLSLDPASLSVERGESSEVALSVDATGGFAEDVTLSAEDVPADVTVTFDPSAATSESAISIAVAESATAGTYDVTVRGESGSLNETAALQLEVTDPPAEIQSLEIVSTPGASEVRQGVGTIELIARGRNLADPGNPRLVEVGIDGSVDPTNSNNTSVRFAMDIPHGVEIGAQTLSLDVADVGTVTLGDALTITPIVAAPDGSDTGRGTFESPFDVLTAIAESASGDTVHLTAGEHFVDASLTVKDGTRLEGVGPESELQADVFGNGYSLQVDGEGQLAQFTLSGFGNGMRFDGADVVEAEGIMVNNSEDWGLRMSDTAEAEIRDSTFSKSAYSGILLEGSVTLMLSDAVLTENGYAGIFIIDMGPDDYKNVVVEGVTISDNEEVGMDIYPFDGNGTLKVRDATIRGNGSFGIWVDANMDELDFGTSDDPGGNVLTGNRTKDPDAYELYDGRDPRVDATGPIVYFVGNEIEGESFSSLTEPQVGGVGGLEYSNAGVNYWRIQGENNRIRFAGP